MNDADSDTDFATRPLPFWLLWGVPIAIMLSLNFIRPPAELAIGVLSVCFAWMGIGCAINARRCHRRHCYYSSPILLVGAALTALVAFGFVNLGPYGLMYVTWGVFALVMLTFVSEKLFGKYRGQKNAD
ncbi:MAG: hypothetical protein OEM85_16155 [Gammaproteobacteria bacterium]|nr:hypothetical protein [Gammaproteobacteria bacterium]MDH3374898.1 hypothetical protein [Gammaproteobacteria bacterium]MDH3409964.1 hypothetical protein [Gammaproteobacteria bacterium]